MPKPAKSRSILLTGEAAYVETVGYLERISHLQQQVCHVGRDPHLHKHGFQLRRGFEFIKKVRLANRCAHDLRNFRISDVTRPLQFVPALSDEIQFK